MKKLKLIQFGINHEHAPGKYASLKYLKDTYELVGVVDDTYLNSPSMPFDREIYKDAKFITSEEAFQYKGLDVVWVEVPNLKLVEIGMEFAKRGIPMHLDKPAGESLPAYKKLLDLCKRNHVPLQMGYMYRGNPALQFTKGLLQKGVLGDLHEVQMDMNHGYGGDYYQKYMGVFKGGIMFNLGCHLIDFVIAALGQPQKITPFLSSTEGVKFSIKNNCLAVFEYPHTFVMLRACSKSRCANRRWYFSGENGSITIMPPERFDGKPVEVEMTLWHATDDYPAGNTVFRFPPQVDRYAGQLKELAEIVRGKTAPSYSYEHDYLVHKATLAAGGYIDWKTGKELR